MACGLGVAVGHGTQLSTAPSPQFETIGRRLADTGVAVTVLPSTDLYLTGRGADHSVLRGVTHAHKLLGHGVNCSLSTNNVLNPFTPYGDASLIRMANLYANVTHVSRPAELGENEGVRRAGESRCVLAQVDQVIPTPDMRQFMEQDGFQLFLGKPGQDAQGQQDNGF